MVHFNPQGSNPHLTADDIADFHQFATDESPISRLPPSLRAAAEKILTAVNLIFSQSPSIIRDIAEGLSRHPSHLDQAGRYSSMLVSVAQVDGEKEIGALLFFLRQGVLPDHESPTLFKALTLYVCGRLHEFQRNNHLTPLVFQRMIPTGQRDWLITFLASLMVSGDGTFSEEGASTALRLIRETAAGLSCRPDGRAQIISVIEAMRSDQQFHEAFQERVSVDPRLESLVRIDLMSPPTQELTDRDIKIAILKTMLWECVQKEAEHNCYYVAAWLLALTKRPASVYEYLINCLECGGPLADLVRLQAIPRDTLSLKVSATLLASCPWISLLETFLQVTIGKLQEQEKTVKETFDDLFGLEGDQAALFLEARRRPILFVLGLVHGEMCLKNPSYDGSTEDIQMRSLLKKGEPHSSGGHQILRGLARSLASARQKNRREEIEKWLGEEVNLAVVPIDIPPNLRGRLDEDEDDWEAAAGIVVFDRATQTFRPLSKITDLIDFFRRLIHRVPRHPNNSTWLTNLETKISSPDFGSHLVHALSDLLIDPKISEMSGLLAFKPQGGFPQDVLRSLFRIEHTVTEHPIASASDLLSVVQDIPQIHSGLVVLSSVDETNSHAFTFRAPASPPRGSRHQTTVELIQEVILNRAARLLDTPVSPSLWQRVSHLMPGKRKRGLTYRGLRDRLFRIITPDEMNHLFYQLDGKGVLPSEVIAGSLAMEPSDSRLREVDALWQARYQRPDSVVSIARNIRVIARQWFATTIPLHTVLGELTSRGGLPDFVYWGHTNYVDRQQALEDPDHDTFACGYDFAQQKIGSFVIGATGIASRSCFPTSIEVIDVDDASDDWG